MLLLEKVLVALGECSQLIVGNGRFHAKAQSGNIRTIRNIFLKSRLPRQLQFSIGVHAVAEV